MKFKRGEGNNQKLDGSKIEKYFGWKNELFHAFASPACGQLLCSAAITPANQIHNQRAANLRFRRNATLRFCCWGWTFSLSTNTLQSVLTNSSRTEGAEYVLTWTSERRTCSPGPASDGAVLRYRQEFWESFLMDHSTNCPAVTIEAAEVIHLEEKTSEKATMHDLLRIYFYFI